MVVVVWCVQPTNQPHDTTRQTNDPSIQTRMTESTTTTTTTVHETDLLESTWLESTTETLATTTKFIGPSWWILEIGFGMGIVLALFQVVRDYQWQQRQYQYQQQQQQQQHYQQQHRHHSMEPSISSADQTRITVR